jgi:hypothetical protein
MPSRCTYTHMSSFNSEPCVQFTAAVETRPSSVYSLEASVSKQHEMFAPLAQEQSVGRPICTILPAARSRLKHHMSMSTSSAVDMAELGLLESAPTTPNNASLKL